MSIFLLSGFVLCVFYTTVVFLMLLTQDTKPKYQTPMSLAALFMVIGYMMWIFLQVPEVSETISDMIM